MGLDAKIGEKEAEKREAERKKGGKVKTPRVWWKGTPEEVSCSRIILELPPQGPRRESRVV